MGGWIKLHRKILEWEWYSDINTMRIFIHCLLKSNIKDVKYKGQDIPRGSFLTTLDEMVQETELTKNEIRTALKHLKTSHTINTRKYINKLLVTVENYGDYQGSDCEKHTRLTHDFTYGSHTVNTPAEEEYKEYKKEKVDTNVSTKKKFSAPDELEPEWTGYVQMRKELKKPLTDRAAKMAVKKLEELAPRDYELQKRILDQSTFNSWQGLFALKAEKAQFSNSPQQNGKRKSFTELVAERTKT